MNDIEFLEQKIQNLEKENESLQTEMTHDVKVQADLIIKNKELEQENLKLQQENDKLKENVKNAESIALELADELYKVNFGVDGDGDDKIRGQ